MHLGNVATALVSWLAARKAGGRWILRIEDLDPQRSRRSWAELIEDDLQWLGLDFDEGGLSDRGPHAPYSQSRRTDLYMQALERLQATGMTYPCRCTRADLMASSAPQTGDGRKIYNGRCRPATLPCFVTPSCEGNAAVRLAVTDEDITFSDAVFGLQRVNPAREVGDFVVRRADGAWAYQLAVVVDDADMEVSEVVRGSDLLTSAAQQIYLFRLLGLDAPAWFHVPLLCNAQGRRLSKRDGALGMESLRRHYTAPEVIGRAACAVGLIDRIEAISPAELLGDFAPEKITPAATVNLSSDFGV